ncbi:MAG: acylneuraminate cytidylyltransferase family protein [Gammaproteobacteria bacterium]|nr:acylneuraminate cytidylyltransferase family protein [Gammaproteobacteria bacterium]
MTGVGEILVVIPARGGSKRLPRKNVLPLAHKPMICWTIEEAIAAKLSGRIMVSSDDEEILTIARRYQADGVIAHRRPDIYATDEATTLDVLIDVLQVAKASGFQPKTLIILQPTSPLRRSDDILEALDKFRNGGCLHTVVSVCEVDHPTAWIGSVTSDSFFIGASSTSKRSQEYDTEYRLNGAVYILNTTLVLQERRLFTEKTLASKMPRSRSLDIDDWYDFKICEALLSSRSN